MAVNGLLKQPLNIIEQPIQPFIQRDPPEFKWSKRHWMVNAGETLRNQETNTQSYDDAVLAVARSENQTRYGQRSYISKVDKNFRPPIVDPMLDLMPLSRMPRPATQARTNPVAPYRTQNTHDMDVSSNIDNTRLSGAVRASEGINMRKPVEYEVLPDLEYVMPQAAAESRKCIPLYQQEVQPDMLLVRANPIVRGDARAQSIVLNHDNMRYDQMKLDRRQPSIRVTNRKNSDYRVQPTSGLEGLELDEVTPFVRGESGMDAPYKNAQTSRVDGYYELGEKLNGRDARSGNSMRLTTRVEQPQEVTVIEDPIQVPAYSARNSIYDNQHLRQDQASLHEMSTKNNLGSFNRGGNHHMMNMNRQMLGIKPMGKNGMVVA